MADLLRAEQIEKLPLAAIPAVLAHLASIQSLLAARLLAEIPKDRSVRTDLVEQRDDRLLTLEEAALALRVDTQWIYKHRKLPFRVKLAGKTLRFSENGIKKWLAGKGKLS
jgi:predicted DNA-binding transcriptional regulator AlpA